MLASSTSLGKLSWYLQVEPCRLQKHVQALVQHTVRKAQAGQVGPRALANVAYGAARCVMIGMLRMLAAALSTAAERRLSEFNAQEIANTAWAFATVNYQNEKLFAVSARAAERRLSEFNPQNLSNTA